ncbi:phosphatidylethanolamine N-methyltransferase, putative [Candida dubliniensis CD36]|uniref:Phosphatidylethanolamine N-methyltransferase n=1 Tax=Candida dubliniensis (strain CD36 / ATCC MYA-646 / CBS 7987 / NCPF 3949 / NRRL Y-17841) TaxID=573826 RepID=CHO2_CANDC|nr:phosphatidylethanolamine N-methyltransferase, putative [Candida dubliniensis CD36]B9WL59.1 RecName: Full=Phosphatidylethanolamine N-methyltransferase; Short=PE methyltransferase; Short=PEAMT; Short=PEMT [Candida dubliniensis CD36]CAX39764.1 phosphatidylethanolamine N-methyltransferase, putative [Candida dubliniensis CD36]
MTSIINNTNSTVFDSTNNGNMAILEPVQPVSKGPKGITFSGQTFVVPETHDMVKTLFDPTVRKSNFELIILGCLFSNLLVFLIPNNQIRIYIFIALYIFWRLSYNFGIGWLLQNQSNHNLLVSWSQKYKLFEPGNTSFLAKSIQNEIKSQRGENYDIKSMPVEFNTWLIFRKFVDLILMSDFITFCCVVYCSAIKNNYQFFNNQSSWLVYSRIVFGTGLILFNLWVKVNAHNTIKDYAWYWGDFFFRQINNEELIFDGVFEMVPHPMYSVGYVGYYGFALIAKSYVVLAIAIFGHFLQMIFLHYIENPHIDKIYGPSKNEINLIKILKLKDLKNFDNLKPLVGLTNFNWMRASDIVNLVLSLTYGIIIPLFANSIKSLFILTVGMKLFESISINLLLTLQSYFKVVTKWSLSNDIPVEKSLSNWAVLYNSLINLTYSSLFGMNLGYFLQKSSSSSSSSSSSGLLFSDWFYLRIFLGLLLVYTQFWINFSIIDSIGYFGWFYGDFFIPKSQSSIKNITTAGVYRYLNNPEQIFGVCGVMGIFMIYPTVENFICVGLWVVNNFIRINFIEKSHMVKLYGEQEVNRDSGVTKTVKKHLLPEVIQRRMSNDEAYARTNGISNGRRKSSNNSHSNSVADSLDNFIRDLRNSSTKLSQQKLIELSQNLSFANSDYKLTIDGLMQSTEGELKYTTIGTPVTISWTSPEKNHSVRDWVGLYKIVQTSYSRNKTILSSAGRWTWCKEANGTFIFDREKLFWEEGVYEFRYHLDGKHEVAYISEPFEIKSVELDVPAIEEYANEFAENLKLEIFDKVINLTNINEAISPIANQSDNVIEVYKLISSMISKSTKINITYKIFLNHDLLSIKDVAIKLINIKHVLEELSFNITTDKKDI